MDGCRFELDEAQNRSLSNRHVCPPRMSYYCETCTATWVNVEDRGLKTYIASSTMFRTTVLGYADQAECLYDLNVRPLHLDMRLQPIGMCPR